MQKSSPKMKRTNCGIVGKLVSTLHECSGFYNGKDFCLRGGEECRQLKISLIEVFTTQMAMCTMSLFLKIVKAHFGSFT